MRIYLGVLNGKEKGGNLGRDSVLLRPSDCMCSLSILL